MIETDVYMYGVLIHHDCLVYTCMYHDHAMNCHFIVTQALCSNTRDNDIPYAVNLY